MADSRQEDAPPSSESKVPGGDPLAMTLKHEAALSLGAEERRKLEITAFEVGEVGAPAIDAAQFLSRRLGEYEIIEEIARGGMGIVFKAIHVRLRRLVALKMVLHGGLAGADDRERFGVEAEAAAQLQHPNIVAIYEVGAFEGQPFLSMEYVDGISLARRVEAGPLPSLEAARYLEKTARAVHYAHTRGILHRDLKPANVLLDEQDQPKVTDFGLAKILESESGQTRTGAIMGTPSYMAPEQAMARKDLSPACDVYSLGAILYELLTGRPPFRGETSLATMALVTKQEPVAPRLLNPHVDRDLETICLKCLEKDPGRRYLSAEALGDDLHSYLDGKPITARRLGLTHRALKWCRRNRTLAALLGVCAAALLGLVAGGVAFGVYQQRVAREEHDLREQAEKSAREMYAARRVAELREELALRMLYLAQFHLAHAAWEAGNTERAKDLLARWVPGGGREDLRGWEWFYLQRLCQGGASLRGHEARVFPDEAGPVRSVAFNSEGSRLATAGADGLTRLCDTKDGKVMRSWAVKGSVNAVAFSPDGRRLAAAGEDKVIYLYDVLGDEKPILCRGHAASIQTLAYSPDGKLLASGGDNNSIRLWDPATGVEKTRLEGHTGPVLALAFSPDGKYLASGSRDKTVRVWDPADGQPVRILTGHGQDVAAVAFSPDGGRLASGSFDKTIRFWDPSTGRLVFSLKGHDQQVNSVVFSPDGRRLASGSNDRTIRIWDTVTGQEILMLDGGPKAIDSVAFSPDRLRLAAAGEDKVVRIWEAAGPEEKLLPNHSQVEDPAKP